MNRPQVARWRAALFATSAAAVCVATLAVAAPDARKQAAEILSALTKTPGAERVAGDSAAKARDALRRAEQMRASGDQKHGALLEETALEWAVTAQLLQKTSDREKELFQLQTKTTELETKVFRAQALVEQTVARRARAEEALRRLEEKGAKP